jgi:myo-inositol-1(or 4)-monophosphatase
MTTLPDTSGDIAHELLRDIETTAVELARLAGAEIVTALGTILTVRYKGLGDPDTLKDPVSEVDHRVETLIRARLAERFPQHDIIGEEIDERPGRNHDFVWAVDPVDGTTNFINGFPLFSGSIGVLHRNRPVVGALWCSTGHALRPGVYHARRGGRLHFDDDPIEVKVNPGVRRRLAGVPAAGGAIPWETRKSGSAAIECAFVAAGLLNVAWFARPNIWDISGGVALVEAAGGEARMFADGRWVPASFGPSEKDAADDFDLARWRHPLAIGDSGSLDLLCPSIASEGA